MSGATFDQESTLSMRDLGAILWSGRWLLLGSVLAGIVWGVLILPPGQVARSELQLSIIPVPQEQSIADINWADVLLSAAGLTGAGAASLPYQVAVAQSPGSLSLVLTGDDLASHEEYTASLRRRLPSASEAVLDAIKERQDVLRTIEVGPEAQPLVVQEAFRLERFRLMVQSRRDGVFVMHVGPSGIVPRAPFAAYLRYVLISFAAAVSLTISLHLLTVLMQASRRPAEP